MPECPVRTPKKLIEVALPLDKINEAAAREKSIRHGHPSTLHLWWARRPLAAARAVLFAQLVNDPGYERHLQRGVNKELAALERDRLFKIIEKLVLWENTNNEEVLEEARREIWKSWRETCRLNRDHPQAAELFNPEKLPAFHDPFAGGGTIPLEAQRLGLEAYASDLNPVAVLINKAMIEIPPKFAGRPPVGLAAEALRAPGNTDKKKAAPSVAPYQTPSLWQDAWPGAKGLAEDVRYYGQWMRDEAEKRIGHLYPKIEVTAELAKDRPDLQPLVGQQLTVIAWLWARTVKSPNPAFSHVDVPLVASFWLSTKKGKETWVEPVVEGDAYRFVIRVSGKPKLEETVNRKGGMCLMSGTAMPFSYIRSEGKAKRMGQRLMAIVAEGTRGRVYLPATREQEIIAGSATPSWVPDRELPNNPRDFKTPNYGLTKFGDLFTPRQLVALTTFSDLVQEAIEKVRQDALAVGSCHRDPEPTEGDSGSVFSVSPWQHDDGRGLEDGGTGATAYAQAVGVYLACTLGRAADYWSSNATWETSGCFLAHVFTKQAIPMVWDFAEGNPFSNGTGNWEQTALDWVVRVIREFTPIVGGTGSQQNAVTQQMSSGKVVSTDPPYYDNIGYADLSDYFYVWMRRTLKRVFPLLFATFGVPKSEELVATPYRHGGKERADAFFVDGMTCAIRQLVEQAHPSFPVAIYYAFKQSETMCDGGTFSTGWETFLDAILKAGFAITGTWPMRTERGVRSIGIGTNALASSIILVCRKRAADAPTVSRREFIRELNEALPVALDEMTRGGVNSPVAPVDLSQAIIGPGMAIFSKYAAVLEADGSRMSVRTALQLINRFLAEDDFDHDTQFCLHWFENYGWSEGKFGEADVLARAKGTSVDGVKASGVLASSRGVVHLLRWRDYPKDWTPEFDHRTPVWEALHQMVRALQQDSAAAAGALLARMPSRAEPMRQLAYRLFTLCERQGWAEDARAYNELITSWNAIERAAQEVGHAGEQTEMDV